MNKDSVDSTEKLILDAAKKVFIEKGMEGARMHEIAEEANINKALLHYYYRTKEKLFFAVFQYAFQQFLPNVEALFKTGMPFNQRIEMFVHQYMKLLLKNPFIPLFILHEINRNPEMIANHIFQSGINPRALEQIIHEEIEQGNIRPIQPRQLILNIISLCVFPIAAKPLIQRILFTNDSNEYEKFLEERETEVTQFILNAIKIK